MRVQWGELPPELLESISKNLTIYVDYLRFRSVCRSWRSSVPKPSLHLPPQLPWLMLPRRAFFDLSLNKTHLLNPQPSHCTRICGSSHGWLVMLDETPQIRKHDSSVFRLRDMSIEPLPCFNQNSCSRLGWPLLIWVSPNPC